MSSYIPFNKPYLSGKELFYIAKAIESGKSSGNQTYTKKCHEYFQNSLGVNKVLLTTSCTDALEMSALLADINPGDEVILPSYTFVSTANAFILRGAKLVFADSNDKNPNIDVTEIESLITPKTKAIVVVHYAGIACDMDVLISLCKKYNLFLIEDAAQAIDSFYKGKPLGSLGDFAAFSFHETKNIICGEGGLLSINNKKYEARSEIIWEKGTNRSAFFRGEVDKYGWVDIGSSFLASDILAAFLYAQLENLETIQNKRKKIWNKYHLELTHLEAKGDIRLPFIPHFASNNGHMFYIICDKQNTRQKLIQHLRTNDVHAVFHYLSLHKSSYYKNKHDGRPLVNCDQYANNLLRLPLYFELDEYNQDRIISSVKSFFE